MIWHSIAYHDAEILFIHIREPEEIQRAVNAFNAKTLLVKRIGLENIETNSSDANVDNYPYDYIIKNYTIEQLDASALNFMNELSTNKQKVFKKNYYNNKKKD